MKRTTNKAFLFISCAVTLCCQSAYTAEIVSTNPIETTIDAEVLPIEIELIDNGKVETIYTSPEEIQSEQVIYLSPIEEEITPRVNVNVVKEYKPNAPQDVNTMQEIDFAKPMRKEYVLPKISDIRKYPPELRKLIAMGNPKARYGEQQKEEMMAEIRTQSIKDAAYAIAVQTAVKWRYTQINLLLESQAEVLDKAFDFEPLTMYRGKLLPPVITKAGASFQLKNQNMAVSSDTTFRISQKAKIITKSPSWRDYMFKEFRAIDNVSNTLIPENKEEEKVWKEAVIDGWLQGMEQAYRVFSINLNRLKRDYNGIITFLMLQEQNVVSLPQLSDGKYAVQVSEDGNVLDIDRRIFRITKNITFTQHDTWDAKASRVQ